jgi:hypothetical protein
VIEVGDRNEYMQSLEAASVKDDATPFARFVAERVGRSAQTFMSF